MFDWDKDFDEMTAPSSLVPRHAPVARVPSSRVPSAGVAPGRGRIRRALLIFGVPLIVIAALFSAPHFTPLELGAGPGVLGLQRLTQDLAMPDGLRSYDHAQYDNFRRGIARFSDLELLAYAAATRRDHANPRLSLAEWDLDVLRLTDLEITRRGLQPPVSVSALGPLAASRPAPARAI